MNTAMIQKVALSGVLVFGAGEMASFALAGAIQKSVNSEQQQKKKKAPSSDEDSKKKSDPLVDVLESEQTDQQVLGTLVAQVTPSRKKKLSKTENKKPTDSKVGPASPYLATKVAIVEADTVRGVVINRFQKEQENELKSSGQVILDPEKIREKYLVSQGRLPEEETDVKTCKKLHDEESFLLVEQLLDEKR